MSSITLDYQTLSAWADQASFDLMMLELSDLQEMAKFTRRLEEQATQLAALAAGSEADNLVLCLRKAATGLKGVILKDTPDPASAMADVTKAIENIQSACSQRLSGAIDPEPAPAAPDTASDTLDDQPAAAEEYLPWVDDVIIAAFVEQQITVLPEMEQLVLGYETSHDPALLSSLRRSIHTLKGESGVVGALHIEKTCHRMEDYIEDSAHVATDVLLGALDWIANAVQAFGKPGGMKSVMTPPLDLFNHPADVPPPAPVAPPPPPPAASAAPGTAAKHQPPPQAKVPDPKASAEMAPIGDRELASDFVTEAQEHFETADENLLVLEKDPTNTDSIGAVFRAFHTIKGVAGFLGLAVLGDTAHAAETLLDEVRKGHRIFTGPAVEATFEALDQLKLMVHDLRDALNSGSDLLIRPETRACIAAIHVVLKGGAAPASRQHPEPVTVAATAPAARPIESATPPPPVSPALPPTSASSAVPSDPTLTPDFPEDSEPPQHPSQPPHPAKKTAEPVVATKESGQTMKVEASRIDLLLDTIGELVIAEAIVSGDPEIRSIKSLRVEKSLALLGKITRSLQDMGMSMRLVPIDPVFRKMARLVRDLSHKSGKTVELKIEGGETELDKSMVDKLGDPLVHMIRNSMDHGIESADDRVAAGKPRSGTITLRAYHKGGNIHIDIEDDGRGLNREAIIAKAIERGLIRSGDGLADSDVFAMIFEAGFSTAAKVTELSGRGVGMDVVLRNIESLRGTVFTRSTPGVGTVFTLSLPLTTAIIDGMLARVGQETFILPTLSVLESFRPTASQLHPVSGHGEMVSFRDSLLPMFRLGRILNVPSAQENPLNCIVMVVEEMGKQWGLMVDELLGQQQVVIKNLGDGVGTVPGVAGASILADGRPGLILDVGAIVRLATT